MRRIILHSSMMRENSRQYLLEQGTCRTVGIFCRKYRMCPLYVDPINASRWSRTSRGVNNWPKLLFPFPAKTEVIRFFSLLSVTLYCPKERNIRHCRVILHSTRIFREGCLNLFTHVQTFFRLNEWNHSCLFFDVLNATVNISFFSLQWQCDQMKHVFLSGTHNSR
jgi:hypothetical protein